MAHGARSIRAGAEGVPLAAAQTRRESENRAALPAAWSARPQPEDRPRVLPKEVFQQRRIEPMKKVGRSMRQPRELILAHDFFWGVIENMRAGRLSLPCLLPYKIDKVVDRLTFGNASRRYDDSVVFVGQRHKPYNSERIPVFQSFQAFIAFQDARVQFQQFVHQGQELGSIHS